MVRGSNCSPIIGQVHQPDKPQRFELSDLCKCNQKAYDLDPGVCDLLCPQSAYWGDCYCIDHNFAGLMCRARVCKMAGVAFCEGGVLGSPRDKCKENVNLGKMNEIQYCSCGNGKRVGDRCQCDRNYEGILCTDYKSPPVPPPPIPKGPESGQSNLFYSVGIPLIIVAVFVIFVVIFAICRGRSRRYAGTGRSLRSIPGSPISAVPLYSTPMRTQGITTTYAFQPPGTTGPFPPQSAGPFPPQSAGPFPPPVAGFHPPPVVGPYPSQPSAQPSGPPVTANGFTSGSGRNVGPAPPIAKDAVQKKSS